MSRKIKYEIHCSFNHSKISVKIESEDGDPIMPDDLWEILKDIGEDYEGIDEAEEIH